VFFCSIEPESLSAQKALDEALHLLKKEDPSFSISLDPETGQTLLSAMGELHLEILKYTSPPLLSSLPPLLPAAWESATRAHTLTVL
jgi:elongation factor G